MSTATRYAGRIVSVPGSDGFAFIGIGGVTKEDGTAHGLATNQDIFLHKDDCSGKLKVGMEVSFDVIPDRKRGEGKYRAIGATDFVEVEMISDNEPAIPGFALATPPVGSKRELASMTRLPVHAAMKVVPDATVCQVIENHPMPNILRSEGTGFSSETKEQLLAWLLENLFPALQSFGTDYNVLDCTDAVLDHEVDETIEGYRAMGITQQGSVVLDQVRRFKDVRKTLAFILGENLVRRDTVIPIENLPDLFMAVPVWYFWANQAGQASAGKDWSHDDPQVSATVAYFCEVFKSQRWCDTFQLFNRRVRTLQQYKGENIPPHVVRRMQRCVAAGVFDHIVIATPYHDKAGKDWENIDWLRAIDPYVLGFKKGIPYFFVLARFSDAGTFPLLNELVGDTIEFLRSQKGRLKGFNKVQNPYWHRPGGSTSSSPLGDQLIARVNELLAAFDAGNLFDWLRGEQIPK